MSKKSRQNKAAAEAASSTVESTNGQAKSEFEQQIDAAAATVEHVSSEEAATVATETAEGAVEATAPAASTEKKVVSLSLPKADKPLHKIKEVGEIVTLAKSDPQCEGVTDEEMTEFVSTHLPKPEGHAPRNAFQAIVRLRRLAKARKGAAKKSLPVPTMAERLEDMLRS